MMLGDIKRMTAYICVYFFRKFKMRFEFSCTSSTAARGALKF